MTDFEDAGPLPKPIATRAAATIGFLALLVWTGYGALLWLVACGMGIGPNPTDPSPSGMAACTASTALLLFLAARVRPKDLGARVIQTVFFCYFWTASGAAFLLVR